MRNFLITFSFLLSVQFISAQNREDQVSIIKTQRMASNAAIAKHDVDGIAKYWLPDFIQVRGNATWLVGKDTIISTWKELFRTNLERVIQNKPGSFVYKKPNRNYCKHE